MSGNVHQDDATKLKITAVLEAAIEALLTTIAGDTTSMDTKMDDLALDDTVADVASAVSDLENTLNDILAIVSTHAKQDTIIGHVDGLEGLLTTIDAVLDNVYTELQSIDNRLNIVDDWDNANSDGASVSGDRAHSAVDSGEPVKIGGKAIDYEPDSAGEQGPAEVTANDRANLAANLRGELITAVKPQYTEPTNIDTTYDGTPSTATSGWIECWQYRQATFGFDITKSGTPTDILIEIEVDLGDGNVKKMMNNFLGDWRYDDTAVGTGIKECCTFEIGADRIRITVTCTGVSGLASFTMANSVLYLRT